MAVLTKDAVTVERAWTEGGVDGKDVVCMQVTLVLTGQGGNTNTIPASVLGLAKIEQVGQFVRDDSKLIIMGPSYDGAVLHAYDMKQATDASRDNVASVSDTIRGVVKGFASPEI